MKKSTMKCNIRIKTERDTAEEDEAFARIPPIPITVVNFKQESDSDDDIEEPVPTVPPPDECTCQILKDVKEESAGKSNGIPSEGVKGEDCLSEKSMVGSSDVCNVRIPEYGTVGLHTAPSSFDRQEEDKNQNHIVTKFSCPMCCKEFPRKRFYDRHVATHSNACVSCYRRFRFKYELKRPTGEYAWPRKNVCLVCLTACDCQSLLYSHMVFHHKDIRFRCSVCERRFIAYPDYVYHKRLHRGLLEYQCPVCSALFRKVQSLKYHMSLHTGEKVFSCEFCTQKFIRHSDLCRHRDKHNEKQNYSIQLMRRILPPQQEPW